MTASLALVFEEVSRLPEEVQERYAAVFRSEIEDDAKWSKTFEDTTASLDALGERAVAEHRAGKSSPLDPSKM